MKIETTITGGDELAAMLDDLSSTQTAASVARSAVSAGVKVVRSAGVRLSPGRVKLEWGQRIATSGSRAVGEVGLGVGGYRGNVERPHGHYLDKGTQYIAARNFVATAVASSAKRAESAMRRTAKSRINRIKNSHE